jgi:hypothetical protein
MAENNLPGISCLALFPGFLIKALYFHTKINALSVASTSSATDPLPAHLS